MVNTLKEHELLVEGLMHAGAWAGTVEAPMRITTHISSVILAGNYAYKIKKPLNLGFLDYSRLELRRRACEEEVRLNRRFAPQIYLQAVPVTGTLEHPSVDGDGEIIDWAVKMRRFDPNAVLALHPNSLNRGLIERLARSVSAFHQRIALCPPQLPYGSPDGVYAPMVQNFSQIRALRAGVRSQLDRLANWTEQRYGDLQQLLERRKAGGHVRECHGDLHLGNVALIHGEPVVFDGIEFNPGLRWIDTASDLAFITMDLTRIGRADLAREFLDVYLQDTGDYAALPLLHFYEVYRAMVRAKVHAIHGAQQNHSPRAREQSLNEFRRYLRTAEAFTRPGPRGLIITKGVAASGKSTLSGSLIGKLPAVRVRSDVERKRLAGLDLLVSGPSRLNAALYSPDMTTRTYNRLAELAGTILDAGFIAIVDATFLKREQRRRFAELAAAHDVPFVILNCEVPESMLRERLSERLSNGDDPSDATVEVLEAQLATRDGLSAEELAMSLPVRPDCPLELDELVRRLR